MKALKLLTQVKTYVPSIYRALAKYACNLYRKCTSQVLKQNSLLSGNFILTKVTPTSKFLRLGFDLASGFHRAQSMKSRGQVDENSSGRRKWLEERVKKGIPRAGLLLEMQAHDLKIGAKANLFDYVFNTRCILSPNQVRTLFYLRSSLSRMCTLPVPSLHQEKDGATTVQVWCSYGETYYKGKRRLKESPNKVRTEHFAFLLIFMKNVLAKIVVVVQLVHRLFTNALLKRYRKGTEKLLESYQIGTKVSSLAVLRSARVRQVWEFSCQCVAQASVMRCICIDKAWIVRKTVAVYALLTHYQRFIYASSILDLYCKGDSFQTNVFKHLKFLSWVKMRFSFNKLANRLKMPLNRMLTSVHDAVSECVVYQFRKLMGISFNALKSIRTYSLLVLMVSMFSLSAQTPRKDSGADGLSNLLALQPGDKIPDAVWNQTLELNYFDGKKKKIKFSDLKGKLILLDFWATTCPSCIENIPHMEEIQKRYQKEVAILLVNSKRNKDTRGRIKFVLDRYREKYNFEIRLPTILDDSLLTNLYPHNTIPNITWINQDGMFMGNTLPVEVGVRNIESILENKTAVLQLRSEFRNKSDGVATPPVFDTTGVKFLSAITGYLPYYLPTYPNVIHKNGNSNYQMVNAAFNFMLLNAFKRELEGFENTDYVFEDGLEDKVETMLSNGSSSENQYCYQLFVNDTISVAQAEDRFQEAFIDYFRLHIERKYGPVSFYSASTLDKISSLKSKGGMPQVNVNPEDGPVFFENYPLETVLSLLHLYFDKPVSYKRHPDMQIDLTFPIGFERMSIKERLTFLASKGILLTMGREEKAYPYISRIH
ncbi:TlpA family protein disulfide reductase [Sphingobacterium kitahiroshimense]|uniref:TlpA family protein disulfide reductase n=1 Tax=Sphingobacterium kitahiroshimense TaxID=470446 RepID=UPI003208F846